MPTLTADVLERTTEPVAMLVERDRVQAYADATNDRHPAYPDDGVPPVFAVVPSWDIVFGLGKDVIPPEHHLMIVHGWQDMRFHRPMRVGDVLTSRADVHSIRGDRLGAQVVIRARSEDLDGRPVLELLTTTVVRGLVADDVGPDRPEHVVTREERGEKLDDLVLTVDDDQTFRYAEASGDHMPIHLDADLARSVGLPGIITHGLCTMALCSQAVLRAAGDVHPDMVRRLAVRFTRPVIPGSQLIVSTWEAGTDELGSRYAFEAKSRNKVVVKEGLAVLGPPPA